MTSKFNRLGTLAAGTLLLWFLTAYLARRLWGDEAVAQSAAAMLICLVPAMATFLLSQRFMKGPPDQQLLAYLGSTGLRMFAVLGAGLAAFELVPILSHTAFWIWLIVFYLSTLAMEIGLLLAGKSESDAQARDSGRA